MRKTMGMAAVVMLMAGTAFGQDPSGFTEALNAERAARGLPPVQYDAGAVATAAANNQAQLLYGLGHHVTNGLGQVAAIGAGDARAALAMWLNSPAHAGLLLAPDLTAVGYHGTGYAATAATRQSFAPMIAVPPPPVHWIYPVATSSYPLVRWYRLP